MAISSGHFPRDLIAGLLFLGIGIAILVAVPSQIQAVDHGLEVGPRYLPNMMGMLMVGLSSLLIVRTFVDLVRNNAETIPLKRLILSREAMGVTGLIVLWVVGLHYLPFLIVTNVVAVLSLFLFRVKPIAHYLVAVGFVLVVWAAFTFILNVRLP